MAKMSYAEKLFVNSSLDFLSHKFFGAGRFLRHVEPFVGSNFLEIGCGIGITTHFIRNKFPQAFIVATDYDELQIDTAKRRWGDNNVTFSREDATDLSFAANSFDACFALLVFHHVQNFRDAIREIYRVLRNGGRLYVMEIFFPKWIRFGHVGIFTKQELVRELNVAGFQARVLKGHLLFWIECEKI